MKNEIVLHIPKNHTAAEAYHIDLAARTIIRLDEGAKATVVLRATSPDDAENSIESKTEIYLGANASLTLVDLQKFSQKTTEVAEKRAELSDQARLHWTLVMDGGKTSKTSIETVMKGEGSEAQVDGLLRARNRQHLELSSTTKHLVPHTTANILVKATATDKAKTIFQGMIRIEKEAQQTNSYMANRNLLLSETAHADSIPKLEIEADDVKASHGATIGELDREQLYYLRSRGLDKTSAEQLLLEGFYEEIIGKIPLPEVQQWIQNN